MDEYTFIIQPVVSLSPSPLRYEYIIKACYEIGQRHTYKHVILSDFVVDAKNHTELAERFQYMIKWEESYEKGKTNEKIRFGGKGNV